MKPNDRDPTDDLHRSWDGDRDATHRLYESIYDELHRLASQLMRNERVDHTLQPTALVNEVFLRVLGGAPLKWTDRVHLLRIFSTAMRHVLVDHAREKGAAKRGGGRMRWSLDDFAGFIVAPEVDHIAVDEALREMASSKPDFAEIVQMHYYGGMTGDKIALEMNLAPRTIDNRLRLGRNWLGECLTRGEDD